MTKVLLPILAVTVIASWLAYLAGYKAGQREQMQQTLLDIEVLRRAEDDRVQPVDPRIAELMDSIVERYGGAFDRLGRS